jgi:hypothetical protein
MNSPVALIPPPPIVREKHSRHISEGRLLRSLSRLSVRAAEERHSEILARRDRQPEGVTLA